MTQFMLLLHEQPADFSDVSPEEIQAIIAKYDAWRDSLSERGLLMGGQKLADEGGRWLRRGQDALSVVDGPYTEAKEIIGGYFIIAADDYDQAVKIAGECPHLDFGGRIELRAIDLME